MALAEEIQRRESGDGLVIVLSGPSGVGKDTLLVELEAVCPGLSRCVTYTTREPRQCETPGVDYNFVTEDEFRGLIESGGFLEYAKVHLNMYGTPVSSVDCILAKGKDAVLKVDVQGGLAVKEKMPDAIMIFVGPPSFEELERRLRARYTDTEASIAKRLSNAGKELDCIPMYDYLVINDDVKTAVDQLRCIIVAERLRIRSGKEPRPKV